MTASSGQFESSDPDQFRQDLGGLVPHAPGVECLDASFDAKVHWGALPRLACFSLDSVSAARIDDEQADGVLGINVPLTGEFGFRDGRSTTQIGPGECFVRRPGEPFEMIVPTGSSLLVVHLSESLFEPPADGSDHACRFDSAVSLRTPAGRSFARDLGSAWEELKRGAPALGAPIAVDEFEASLSASFASIAAASSRDTHARPIDSHSAWLVRAEEYLASRLAEPVSLADVAQIAGVSTRTLSRGFLERHGMGPIAFLKRRRLDAVHRALLASDGETTSVTDLAMTYGFTHLGRFAGDYRRCFGEHPSRTLHGQRHRTPA